MDVTISLKVKPWLFKYLSRQYGNPYLFDVKDSVASVLFTEMQDASTKPRKQKKIERTCVFNIKIQNLNGSHTHKLSIYRAGEYRLNRIFEEEYFQKMCIYVQAQQQLLHTYKTKLQKAGISKDLLITNSIFTFNRQWAISEDEMCLDSARRNYNNYMKAGKVPHFSRPYERSTGV